VVFRLSAVASGQLKRDQKSAVASADALWASEAQKKRQDMA